MQTFTFDNFYFFDRQSYDECWYVYTHPQKDPFFGGRFDVVTCRFMEHCENHGEFGSDHISAIEHLLKQHRAEMGLAQFEIHKIQPDHYRLIRESSAEFKSVYKRMRNGGKWDPKFSLAFDLLKIAEPAYRLNREFVNRVLFDCQNINETDWMEYFKEDCQDSWTYDSAPTDECPTFDAFFQQRLDELFVPTIPEKRFYKVSEIYEIEEVADLYLVRHDLETYFYYRDAGDAVVPVPLPPRSGWLPQYIL